MSKEKTKKASDKKSPAALAIPAGIFIGMGIGFLSENFVPWMFIGLGAGFTVFFNTQANWKVDSRLILNFL